MALSSVYSISSVTGTPRAFRDPNCSIISSMSGWYSRAATSLIGRLSPRRHSGCLTVHWLPVPEREVAAP